MQASPATVIPLALFGALLLVPWLDRGPQRHPLNRPLATPIAVAALAATITFTAQGAISR